MTPDPDRRPTGADDAAIGTPGSSSVTWLLRSRTILITLMLVVVAAAASDVFDRSIRWLLFAPVATGGLGIVAAGRGWGVRVGAAVGGVAASSLVVAIATGGGPTDAAEAFGAGPRRLLTTEWPSPDRPDLVATVAALVAIATAAATELARHRRLHLLPLVPVALAHVAVIGLSAPAGVRLRWVAVLGILAIAHATLRPGSEQGLRDRLAALDGERRLLPVGLGAIGLTALLAAPIHLDDRADPRADRVPDRTLSLLDPIEATVALQLLDPPIDLHEIAVTEGSAPALWRTASLSDYDGSRWSPDLTLRPIGRRLGSDGADAVSATVAFLDDDLRLVPLPGSPIVVDAAIETDVDRTVVVLAERPRDGETIAVSARPGPPPDQIGTSEIATLAIDTDTLGLRDLADALIAEAGSEPSEATIAEQLLALETTLRDDFELRADAPGGGLQRTLIERFLRDTRRGNAEQFATAFVLLARSLGVDARVATGFRADPDAVRAAAGAGSFVLTSRDAAIWPEVRAGDRWVPFDPVPPVESADAQSPPPEPQVQTPAAPQPPMPPPVDADEDPTVTEADDDTAVRSGLPLLVEWALRAAAVVGAVAAPVLLLVALVLLVKWRRRRRWLHGDPDQRIRGAWAVATNRLVDAGMVIRPSDTNGDIAHRARAHVDSAHREIGRLATLASASTFGEPSRPDLLAQDATGCLATLEAAIVASMSLRQRLRWELSLRSLRRRTSSPV